VVVRDERSQNHGVGSDDEAIDGPVHPTVVRWLSAYALAVEAERDATVAAILGELNRVLLSAQPAASWSDDRGIGVALDIAEQPQAEEDRAAQRERQARLTSVLASARQLADRATSNLAASSGVIGRLRLGAAPPSEVRDAIEQAMSGLSEATRAIAELQHTLAVGWSALSADGGRQA
jgi:hypothetical protein